LPTITHIESEAKFRKRFGDEVPFQGAGWYDKSTGTLDTRPPKPLGVPMIISDIPAHVHRGEYIGGRAQQRSFMDKHGLTTYERVGPLQNAPKGVYDPKCEKWQQFEKDITNTVAKRSGLDASGSALEKRLSGELADHKKKVLSRSKPKA